MTEYILFSVALLVGVYFFFVGYTKRGAGFNHDLPDPLKTDMFSMLSKMYYAMAILLALSALCFYTQVFGDVTAAVSICLVLVTLVCPLVYAAAFRKKFTAEKVQRAEREAYRAAKKRLKEEQKEQQQPEQPKSEKKKKSNEKYSKNYTKKSKNKGK